MERSFDYFVDKWSYTVALQSAIERGDITQDDRDLINEYIHGKQAKGSKKGTISPTRINNITSALIVFRKYMPVPYRDAQVKDIYSGLVAFKDGKTSKGKAYSHNTVYNRITNLKPFVLWLIDSGYSVMSSLSDKEIKKVKKNILDISGGGQDRDTVQPDELYTEEELQRLIAACRTSRDRALIIVMYESGARIGEIARLAWKDCIFDRYGVKLYISDQKTKKKRYSRLTLSTEYLATWKRDSPDSSPDAPVFVRIRRRLESGVESEDVYVNDPITRITVKSLLQRLKRATGIDKAIRPHMFRHTRVTDMIKANYQESAIKKSLWGNLSTPMFSTYVNLSEQDIDDEFLERAGVEVVEETPSGMRPVSCGECNTTNMPGNDFCYRCGVGLSEQAISQEERLKRQVAVMVEEAMKARKGD